VNLINHRPRKSLDYRIPYEVFFASSDTVAFHPWIGDSLRLFFTQIQSLYTFSLLLLLLFLSVNQIN